MKKIVIEYLQEDFNEGRYYNRILFNIDGFNIISPTIKGCLLKDDESSAELATLLGKAINEYRKVSSDFKGQLELPLE